MLTKYVKVGWDTSIKLLLAELIDHLNSIEANTVQTGGIEDRMLGTKALVDDALYRRADLLHDGPSVADS